MLRGGDQLAQIIKLFKKVAWIGFALMLLPAMASASEQDSKSLGVKAAMLVDMRTGQVLYQFNADRLIQPASLSKIMSLYLIHEAIESGNARLSDLVMVSANAVNTGGSKILYEKGVRVPLGDLLMGMAVYSANDASVALAEHFGGSVDRFVDMMNFRAGQLGMQQTHFVNPHGLPHKRQKTTAREILLLSCEYMKRFPGALKIHSMENFTFDAAVLTNRNDLVRGYPGVDGLKTGYVRAAGFHMVATAVKGDQRLIAIVLGAQNPKIRSRQTRLLLDYGFRQVQVSSFEPLPGG
jgi:D-alanyl-D-alanine carboxypeptidase (penicillin-binding protein 5/6)